MSGNEANREETLSELLAELRTAQREIEGIGEEVLKTVEDKWTHFHTVLYPHLLTWQQQVSCRGFLSFSHQGVQWRHEPRLSFAGSGEDRFQNVPGVLAWVSGSLQTDLPLPESVHRSLQLYAPLAFASREMQIDFASCITFTPFCLFDHVSGIIVGAHDSLQESEAQKIFRVTETLLDRLRREIIRGRLHEISAHNHVS